MVVKVYGPDYACPKRVIVCLIEKEIEYEAVYVNGLNGGYKQSEYLKLQVKFLLLNSFSFLINYTFLFHPKRPKICNMSKIFVRDNGNCAVQKMLYVSEFHYHL
ncbi:putative glutathione transferase [Lupinus albus]|uniref:Putative glutathione transferase n=1 Tax=Lupinus albus TaxID=3870 RepID=A0A6A4QAS3_LUPAL|nr:putative glutathione transferase [Lupinus albus]